MIIGIELKINKTCYILVLYYVGGGETGRTGYQTGMRREHLLLEPNLTVITTTEPCNRA